MHAAFVIPTNLEMTFTIRESIDIQTIVRVRNIWGKTFFFFSLSLQIPCLIRFIVQVLSNFFERVLYNVAKLLVIACNSHNLEDEIHNQRVNWYPKTVRVWNMYLEQNFFLCLSLLSNFFEWLMYNVVKLLVASYNSHNIEDANQSENQMIFKL